MIRQVQMRRACGLVSFLALQAGAGLAMGQETPQDTAQVDEIVVIGYRYQNAQAIALKQNTATIADFLAADEIGQQPDYNIADSIRRAPGVQTVFDEDEGRYVAIRGLNPDYTIGSFDGLTIASSERGNRRVNLEAVPSAAIRRVGIYKARTPDLEGNAIGGTIELGTRSAYDASGPYFVGSAFTGFSDSTAVPGEGYNRDSDDGPNIRGEATASMTFGPNDQFGLLVSGLFNRKRRDQDRYIPNGYPDPATTGGVEIPNEFLWSAYPNTVDRYGGQIRFDWRPNDQFEATASVVYYAQDDNELRHSQGFTRGGTTTATGAETATVSQASGYIRINDFPIEKPLTVAQLSARYRPDDRNLFSVQAGYSEASFVEKSNELRFNLANSTANAFTYDRNGGTPTLTFSNPATVNNPSAYAFAYYRPYQDDSDEYVREGRADWNHNTERGAEGFGFSVGVKGRETIRDNDRYQLDYSGTGVGTGLTLADFDVAQDFTGVFGVVPYQFIDLDRFLNFFTANPGRFPINARTTQLNGLLSDYVVTETVGAAYGALHHAGSRHRLIVGGRFETTETEVERVASLTQLAAAPAPRGLVDEILPVPSTTTRQFIVRADSQAEYDHFLPSALLTYDLTDTLRLRASYAKAIGRPNLIDLAANETVSTTATPTINRGNPDLQPRESDNFDLQLDWAFGGNTDALLSVGVFSKDIKNDIFRATSQETIDGVVYQVNQPQNVTSAEVRGLELSIVKNELGFLPIEGFGASANITFYETKTEILMNNGTRRPLDQLLQQADVVANVALFYDHGPLTARVTYAYIGPHYTGISTGAARDDQREAALNQLDLQARYRLNDQWQLVAEARNVTDEHRETFTGANLDLARDLNYYGRQFSVGATFQY